MCYFFSVVQGNDVFVSQMNLQNGDLPRWANGSEAYLDCRKGVPEIFSSNLARYSSWTCSTFPGELIFLAPDWDWIDEMMDLANTLFTDRMFAIQTETEWLENGLQSVRLSRVSKARADELFIRARQLNLGVYQRRLQGTAGTFFQILIPENATQYQIQGAAKLLELS